MPLLLDIHTNVSGLTTEAVESAPLSESIEETSTNEETDVAVAESEAVADEDMLINEKADVAVEAVRS